MQLLQVEVLSAQSESILQLNLCRDLESLEVLEAFFLM